MHFWACALVSKLITPNRPISRVETAKTLIFALSANLRKNAWFGHGRKSLFCFRKPFVIFKQFSISLSILIKQIFTVSTKIIISQEANMYPRITVSKIQPWRRCQNWSQPSSNHTVQSQLLMLPSWLMEHLRVLSWQKIKLSPWDTNQKLTWGMFF